MVWAIGKQWWSASRPGLGKGGWYPEKPHGFACEEKDKSSPITLRQCHSHFCTKVYTLWTEKNTPKCFLIYSLQYLTDCDKIGCVLSRVNLSYRNVSIFRLTWIVSLPYLVKLSILVLQVNSSWNREPKTHTKMFCHIFYQTILIPIRFGTYFPD